MLSGGFNVVTFSTREETRLLEGNTKGPSRCSRTTTEALRIRPGSGAPLFRHRLLPKDLLVDPTG